MNARGWQGAVLLVATSVAGCGHSESDAPVAGIDETFLDRSTDPCTDFYQFACGTWIKEHPADKTSSIQRFYEGDGRNSYLLRKILEADQMGSPYVPDPASLTVGSYYGTCISSRASDTVDHQKIDDLLAQVQALASTLELPALLGKIHTAGVSALFAMYAGIDPGQPERRIATFASDGIGLDQSYYLDADMMVLRQYQDHIGAIAALFPAQVPLIAPDIVALETSLARAFLSDAAARDPVATYNLLATGAFTATASHFAWADYFSAIGFTSVAEVNVTDPAYLMALDALLVSTPLPALKGYLAWRIVETYAHTLGKSVITEEAKFHYGVFTGDPTVPPDWWACLNSTR
jgi:putative endopeptidase